MFGEWLRSFNPHLRPLSNPIFSTTCIYGTWDYLGPDFMMDEVMILTPLLAIAFYFSSIPTSPVFNNKYKKHTMDYILAAGLIYCLIVMTVSKFLSGLPEEKETSMRIMFLLVPCHVVTSIEIYTLLIHTKMAQSWNEVMLYLLYFPTLALAVPDTSDYLYQVEVIAFYLQHALMVVVRLPSASIIYMYNSVKHYNTTHI